MPTVKKQTPTNGPQQRPTPTPALTPTSRSNPVPADAELEALLADAMPVSQLEDNHVHLCVYGPNRVGKTTFACSFPKPLLILAMEPNKTGGAASVKRVPGVIYERVDNTVKAVAIARGLLRSGLTSSKWPGKLASLVFDGATSYQDIALRELMGVEELPTMLTFGLVGEDMYRQRSEKCREVLREYLRLPCHVVVIAKEKDHNPPKNEKGRTVGNKMTRGLSLESFFAADLGAATAGWLNDTCDYICRLSIDKEVLIKKVRLLEGSDETTDVAEETGQLVRRLRCLYHTNFAAGFRSPYPQAVPEFIIEPSFAKLQKVVNGQKLTPEEGGVYP